jgi:hypothetical protein
MPAEVTAVDSERTVMSKPEVCDMTATDLRNKAHELRHDVGLLIERFAIANPTLPAQVLMAGLGEALLVFSVSQVGPGMTRELLRSLDELLGPRGAGMQ